MKTRLLVLSILTTLTGSILNGQTLYSRDYDLPGEANSGGSVVRATDGNTVFLSDMFSVSNSAPTSYALYKTDVTGNIVWEKHWAKPMGYQSISNVVTFPDSSYVFALLSTASAGTITVTKTDDVGNILYKHAIPIPVGYAYIYNPLCYARNDGSCLLTGTMFDATTLEYLWYVMCVDPSGNFLWTKIYNRTYMKGYVRDIDTCSNGDIVLLADARDSVTNEVGANILRLTSDGALLWSKPWYYSTESLYPKKLKVMPGDFIFVCGEWINLTSGMIDEWISRFTGTGNLIWTYNYTFPNMNTRKLLEVNHRLLLMGDSNYDGLLGEIDSSGTMLWAKKYYNTRPYDVSFGPSGYVITSQSNSNGIKNFSIDPNGDACIDTTIDVIKSPTTRFLQAYGNEDTLIFTQNPLADTMLSIQFVITTNCLVSGIAEHEASLFRIFPNPSNNTLNIDATEIIEELVIYDLSGKPVRKFFPDGATCTADLSGLIPGNYMVVIHTQNNIESHRLIIE